MARRAVDLDEVARQLRFAQAAELRERASGRRATTARYDRASGRIILELTNGFLFGFPAKAIAAIAGFSPEQLAAVKLSPGGGGLEWDDEDMQLSVPGLLMSSLGRTQRLREFARLAGSVRSKAKAAAARRNGAKGGRPRKAAKR